MTNGNSRPRDSDNLTDELDPDLQMGDIELIDINEVHGMGDENDNPPPDDSDSDGEQNGFLDNPENFEELQTGDSMCSYQMHTSAVFCCHLSSDAKYGVSGGEDDMAFVWRCEDHEDEDIEIEDILEIPKFQDSVVAVEFSHDNKYVALACMDGIIKVYKVADQPKAPPIWEENVGFLSWIKWHDKTNVLLAGGSDSHLWKIPSGDYKIFPGTGTPSECGTIMPDGKRCAIGYDSSDVKIFDMVSTNVLHKQKCDEGPITSICARDNNLLAFGTASGKLYLMTTQNAFKVVSIFACVEDPETTVPTESIVFSNDPRHSFVLAGITNGVCVYDYSKKVLREKITEEDGVTRVVWPPGSPFFYVGTKAGSISVYNGITFAFHKKLQAHSDVVLDLCVSRDGRRLLSVSEDSTAMLFDLTKIVLD